jgi:hypothetical protein
MFALKKVTQVLWKEELSMALVRTATNKTRLEPNTPFANIHRVKN